MERIEGSGASQLVQLIRAIGYNSDMSIELATVTAAPPELKIKVDHMNIELEKDDLIVAQSLTKYKRKVNLKSESKTKVSATNMNPEVPPFNFDPGAVFVGQGKISFTGINVSSADFSTEEAELEFIDELEEGDRVVVAGIQQGQIYIILDRAVMY
ncbi:DUF2577 domain-containing protein [Paenibacillus sp. PSB04]|uniref:DUF2577 domain-containing protein n=1 Tax=Paenibacillus sp. PSB04 TaxID=2866810 RepID=UPI0021F0C4A5|nr:DUF2577 domain-containing protein [Paenibacillus sp. PSB04]UYO03011.1 DUF2577 domain-containing protein [Paenibacillus sp. PSB04]